MNELERCRSLAHQLMQDNLRLEKDRVLLRMAAQEFVDRCNRGEVLSIKSKSRFMEVLRQTENPEPAKASPGSQ